MSTDETRELVLEEEKFRNARGHIQDLSNTLKQIDTVFEIVAHKRAVSGHNSNGKSLQNGSTDPLSTEEVRSLQHSVRSHQLNLDCFDRFIDIEKARIAPEKTEDKTWVTRVSDQISRALGIS
jgi:hypothetical protein